MTTDIESLGGKTALITGGAKRLGAAVARRLMQEGVHLVLHHRNSVAEAEALAAEGRAHGLRVALVHADFADPAVAEPFFAEALTAAGGRIDYLVNSASIFPESRFDALDLDGLQENVAVNAWVPFVLARAFGRQGTSGAIINFLDTMILDYDKQHLGYHLSKKMFAAMTRILALELAPQVRVNAVAPGLVLAPIGKPESYLAEHVDSNPLRRHGSADGIAEAVAFLLRSGFITGQTIYVDGGRHMRGSFYGS